MTLRKQTLAIVVLITVALVVFLYAASHWIILGSYGRLEKRLVRQNVERVLDAIAYDLSVLDNHAADWAEWDDTYDFVASPNEHYIRENQTSGTYGILKANMMLFFNVSGEFVFGKAYDLLNKAEIPIPRSVKDIIVTDRRLIQLEAAGGSVRGILLLPEGPLLVVARRILNSQHQGPVNGTLIIGRYLNSEEITNISRRIHIHVEVQRYDDPGLSEDFKEASEALAKARKITVFPTLSGTVAGFALLNDVFGNPAIVLKADMPRDVYNLGRSDVAYFLFFMLLAGLVFSGAIMAVLETRILSRLIGLGKDLSRIAAGGSTSERVSVEGHDELSGLATEINRMLDAVQESERALRSNEERLGLVLEGSNEGFWDWNLVSGEIQRSGRWAEIIGYAPDETGSTLDWWSDRLHPEDKPSVMQILDDHLEGRTPHYEAEYRMESRSGQWKWILDRGKVVKRDAYGRPVRMSGTQSDISERKLAEENFVRGAIEAASFQRVLLDLSKIELADFDNTLEILLRRDAEALRVERASFWTVDQDFKNIHCRKLFLLKDNKFHDTDMVFQAERFPRYIAALTEYRALVADSAQTDERTMEFKENFLQPLGITSMIDVPVWWHGRVVGIVCHEHVGPQLSWTSREQEFAQSIAEMVSLSMEASERHRAEVALKVSEEKYRLVIENANEAIVVTQDGFLKFVNPKATEITGYSAEELALRPLIELVHPDDRETVATRFEKRLEGEPVPPSYSFRLIHKSLETRWVEMTALRIFWEGRNAALSFFSDITAKRKMEDEFLRLEKIRSLGVMAGGIAHDFNNILTAVLGNISLAKIYSTPGEKAFQRLSEAEKACLQAQGLTQQLLAFSKGGAPVKKPGNIVNIIRDSCLLAVSGSRAVLDISVPEDLWAAEVDPGQISQVLSNILINADQAMPQGGVIKISAENVEDSEDDVLLVRGVKYVKIAVQDSGIGIPSSHLPRLFDPYFSTKHRGSGLGLATAYSIIKNHDGAIWVESELGKGTTFCIYLPALGGQAIAQEDSEARVVRGNGRVLLMDDEEAIRELGGEALKLLGYEVQVAREGREAAELYEEAMKCGAPFDAVIMDLTVPGGMGGAETVRILQKLDPQVKAIVSSGYSTDPIMANYEKFGFCDVVPKPYSAMELSQALSRTILKPKSRDS